MGQRNGTAFHVNTWPESTTCKQVMEYASGALANSLVIFLAAERSQDMEQMTVQCKTIRGIATRIDQFRRMRVRQWRVQPESSQKTTSNPSDSGT
jgi:hypothetical protein